MAQPIAIRTITRHRSGRPLRLPQDVALVGNSDRLAEARLGARIDAHAAVVRFNLAPFGPPWHEQVGTRASVVVFNQRKSNLDFPHPPPLAERFMRYCHHYDIVCYPGHERYVLRYTKPYLLHIGVDEVNAVLQSLVPDYVAPFNSAHHPRNGVKVLACLLREGITPTLYGFDLGTRAGMSHYFEDCPQRECVEAGHRPSFEFTALRALADLGYVRVVAEDAGSAVA